MDRIRRFRGLSQLFDVLRNAQSLVLSNLGLVANAYSRKIVG
ncbi:hypothetical protein [Comamonas resistens]